MFSRPFLSYRNSKVTSPCGFRPHAVTITRTRDKALRLHWYASSPSRSSRRWLLAASLSVSTRAAVVGSRCPQFSLCCVPLRNRGPIGSPGLSSQLGHPTVQLQCLTACSRQFKHWTKTKSRIQQRQPGQSSGVLLQRCCTTQRSP